MSESKKLYIASDHAGVQLKTFLQENVLRLLSQSGQKIEWVDLGPITEESVDYPDYAHKLSHEVLKSGVPLTEPCGVLICGSGIGVSMSANKHEGIRAALVWTPELAKLSRAHNAANVLCLPARFLSTEDAKLILEAWLETEFEGGRHEKRVDKIDG